MKIEFSKKFRKDVAKLNQKQESQLKERLELFIKRPTHPALNNHKLKGKSKGYCSINITGDICAIYRIEVHEKSENISKFVQLGTHSELY